MDPLENDPILLCYDRSVGSVRAIETAAQLFPGRRAIILHIWNPVAALGAVYGVPAAGYDEQEVQAAAVRLAEEGAALACSAGLAAKPLATSSRLDGTSRTILRCAEEQRAGLVVLGARGLSAVRSLVLGSVSHGVVQHAHLPVLVVPPVANAGTVVAPVATAQPAAAVPDGIALLRGTGA